MNNQISQQILANVTRTNNFIYLLREREFIKTGENIYKIGKTTQLGLNRFNMYPSGSELLLHLVCENCHTLERKIMDLFGKKYKRRLDIGSEYYEGKSSSMISDIIRLLNFRCANTSEKQNIDNVTIHDKDGGKIEQLKSGYKFIVDFIERTFAGEDVESKSPDDETFRFPFSSLNDEFKKLYAGNRQDTLKKQLLELGIEVKNKRKHRHGNTLTQCVTLYPPDVQKAIRTHLDSDMFEINLKVDEDNDKEDVIKLMDEIAELRRILKIKEDLLEKISMKPA